jgi:hypothetical protein
VLHGIDLLLFACFLTPVHSTPQFSPRYTAGSPREAVPGTSAADLQEWSSVDKT